MTTITLTTPVDVGGITYKELKVRKPRARDFAQMPLVAQQLGDLFPLAANLCDVDRVVIEALDIEDLMAVMNAVTGFLSSAPTASTPTTGVS